MRAGASGTFVISWAQTEIDGLRSGPLSAIEAGATWRWSGAAVRVDRPGDILALGPPIGQDDIEARAAMAVRRIVGRALPPNRAQFGEALSDPLLSNSFVLTDGSHSWTAILLDVAEVARPLLMFEGPLPPSEADLWIARGLTSEGVL
ncbi:MAG: hemolysin-type calcium-binding protein, partial [Pseudomonadota bacterium]